MLRKKECVAMLLAGGQGSRLGILTRHTAKPALPFGGKYRIIDFPVSNCTNSGIDVVGVLTQYRPLELNAYIGNGAPWDLDLNNGGIFVLPPYSTGKQGEWYKGTANSIYQNIEFIEQYNPEYVLVLSGDHIYKMDYAAMLASHIERGAAVTIAVRQVPWAETDRFGIMNTDENGFITEFEEKPKNAKSNNASMGVYMFTWDLMKKYLQADEADPLSSKDFGKNIIPKMLAADEKLVAYKFSGYWKDVGTIESLWEANMDLLEVTPPIDMHDTSWRIYARNVGMPPHYVGAKGTVTNSLISEGGVVEGDVVSSVLSGGVQVDEGARVIDSVLMPGAHIRSGAVITRAIIGENSVVGEKAIVGEKAGDIAVVGNNTHVSAGEKVAAGVQVGE
ncbi:MAG: glucose-1-phosphate adenylyltransferase [Eubacteriales bacterium]|nr:glucose-1-phosphate adenylyltransferase [Eubacteriales bacterium]MDD4105911.1 glucose-1-phosphate adenylyltransferase [Eubacteriales bacterium]MDD4711154.1 glucose-1-phosphate adenylyltransferase [Eubacteriales bacterium]NLO15691.1 glucose-1-phosphate adenylyltransferase [Clostridiales bacterium]